MKRMIKKFPVVLCLIAAILFFVMPEGIKANAVEVGQRLVEPETGWQRIDDANKLILYDNSWRSECRKDVDVNNGTWHVYNSNSAAGSKITFRFKGTKFRIIGACNNGTDGWHGSQNISINVDGKEYQSMSCFRDLIFKCVLYDLEDLADGVHTVTITNKTIYCIWFDAIDISKDAYMLDVNKKYVNKINLNTDSITMNVEDSKALTASVMPEAAENKNITWTSSNPNVCTVDKNGKVTAVSSGKAAITAAANDGSGASSSCNVTVVDDRKGSLSVNMNNGRQYTYDMTMDEINDFTNWYDNRSEGKGKSYYIIKTKPASEGYKAHADYLSFNSISDFSVDIY